MAQDSRILHLGIPGLDIHIHTLNTHSPPPPHDLPPDIPHRALEKASACCCTGCQSSEAGWGKRLVEADTEPKKSSVSVLT